MFRKGNITSRQGWFTVFLIFCSILIISCGATAVAQSIEGNEERSVSLHFFWQEGCPHCARADAYLEGLAAQHPWLELRGYEVSSEGPELRLFLDVLELFKIERPAVPIIVVGPKYLIGFSDPSTSGVAIVSQAQKCHLDGCPDLVGMLVASREQTPTREGLPEVQPDLQPGFNPTALEGLPETVDLPFVGKVELEALSLPILTIVLGAMDGFNPCALWVLVFLISLLMNVKQRWRVWLLGAVFLLASGAVYFAFMAAWLNTVLLLSGLVWLRIGIGLLSIGAGAFFLREFWANPDSLCRVGDFNWRERIRSRLRKSIEATSLVLAILGIAAVAVLVNLVELFCSAGIPVVYSQVLAMSDLAAREYYLFLALYVFVFLLDDILIFVLAMVTLQVVGLTAGVSRIAHLIGAILMSVLGLLLIFRPDLLAFM